MTSPRLFPFSALEVEVKNRIILLAVLTLICSCKPRRESSSAVRDDAEATDIVDAENYAQEVRASLQAQNNGAIHINIAMAAFKKEQDQFKAIVDGMTKSFNAAKQDDFARFWHRMWDSRKSDPWYDSWELDIKRLQSSLSRMRAMNPPPEVLKVYSDTIFLMTKEAGKAIETRFDQGHPYLAAWRFIGAGYADSFRIALETSLANRPDLPPEVYKQNLTFANQGLDNSYLATTRVLTSPALKKMGNNPYVQPFAAESDAMLGAINVVITGTQGMSSGFQLADTANRPGGLLGLLDPLIRKFRMKSIGIFMQPLGVQANYVDVSPFATFSYRVKGGGCAEEYVFAGATTAAVGVETKIGLSVEFGDPNDGYPRPLVPNGVLAHMASLANWAVTGEDHLVEDVYGAWPKLLERGVLTSMNEATAWGLTLTLGNGDLGGGLQIFYHPGTKTLTVLPGVGIMSTNPAKASAGALVKVATDLCPAEEQRRD